MSNVLDNLETLSNKDLHTMCVRYGLPNVGINDANRNLFLKKLRKAMNTTIPDGLDSLNNKELKAECVKWGLKNFPVTDSSRSVLQRRLRAAMAAGDASINNEIFTNNSYKTKSPTATRRTANLRNVNNSSYNSVEKDKTKDIKSKNISNNTTNKTPNRRSMISPIVLHGSDNDDDTHSSVATTASTSFRRSPSLSKSGVFTTSYVQEIKPLKKHLEYQEEDDDVEFVDEYDAMDVDEADDVPRFEQYQLQQQPQQYISPSFGQTSSPYENVQMKFNQYDTGILGNNSYERPPLHNSTSISSPFMTSSLEYEHQQKQQNFYEPIIRGNMTTKPIINYQSNEITKPKGCEYKLNRSTIYKTSTEQNSHPTKMAHSSPITNRHVSFEKQLYTKNNTNKVNSIPVQTTQVPKLYPNLNDLQMEQQLYNHVRLEDDLSDSEETSQIELSSDDDATASTHYASFNQQQPYFRHSRYSNKMSPTPRRPLMKTTTTTIDNNDFVTSLRNHFYKLDQRYHIKQYFALLMAFILVAFIYAFFF